MGEDLMTKGEEYSRVELFFFYFLNQAQNGEKIWSKAVPQ